MLGAEGALRVFQREGHCPQGHLGHAATDRTEGPSRWDSALFFTESQPGPGTILHALGVSSLRIFINFVRWCYYYPRLQWET